jgi:hypothetical protein
MTETNKQKNLLFNQFPHHSNSFYCSTFQEIESGSQVFYLYCGDSLIIGMAIYLPALFVIDTNPGNGYGSIEIQYLGCRDGIDL